MTQETPKSFTEAWADREAKQKKRNKRLGWTGAGIAALAIIIAIVVGVATNFGSNALIHGAANGLPTDTPTSENSESSVQAAPTSTTVDDIEVPEYFLVKDEDGNQVKAPVESAVKWEVPKELNCPDGNAYFFAYDAKEGSNAFGADQRAKINTAEDVMNRMHEKSCDPLWLKGTDQFLKPAEAGGGEQIDPSIRNEALKLSDKALYKETIKSLASEIDKIYVADINLRYESAGMIWGENSSVMPTLTQWGERPVLGKTAIIVLKNGEYRLLRIECDLQWSVVRFYKLKPPAQTYKPTGGSTPPATPPPPRTTTPPPPPPPPTTIVPPPPCCEPPPPPPPPPPPVCPPGSPLPEQPCFPPTTTTLAPKPPELTPFDPNQQGNGGVPNQNQGPGASTIPDPPTNTTPRSDPPPPPPAPAPDSTPDPAPPPPPAPGVGDDSAGLPGTVETDDGDTAFDGDAGEI